MSCRRRQRQRSFACFNFEIRTSRQTCGVCAARWLISQSVISVTEYVFVGFDVSRHVGVWKGWGCTAHNGYALCVPHLSRRVWCLSHFVCKMQTFKVRSIPMSVSTMRSRCMFYYYTYGTYLNAVHVDLVFSIGAISLLRYTLVGAHNIIDPNVHRLRRTRHTHTLIFGISGRNPDKMNV